MEFKPVIPWDQAEVIEDGDGGWAISSRRMRQGGRNQRL